jgi:hypothetical protein
MIIFFVKKCFMKCIGEDIGMVNSARNHTLGVYKILPQFLEGQLIGGNTLRKLEDISYDDPVKLQSGFQAYDECGSNSIFSELN